MVVGNVASSLSCFPWKGNSFEAATIHADDGFKARTIHVVNLGLG